MIAEKSSQKTICGQTIKHLAILAGGKGTRLQSVSGDIPKSLVPVGGKPLLAHQLELARAAGVTNVTIFAGHLADQIVNYIGDGRQFGLNVDIHIEDEPAGNAGAVLNSLPSLPEQFFVLYGDVMLDVDLKKMTACHHAKGADLTLLAHPNDHPFDSDLLECDAEGWVTSIHPSPHPPGQFFANLVNAALYVVRRDALLPWAHPDGKRDFAKDIIPALIASGRRVFAYRSGEYIKDMGTPKRLAKVEADWQAGKIDAANAMRAKPTVFLDRDGTLNLEKGFLRKHDELELLPHAAVALKALRQAGFQLAILTNQPVIARGEASTSDVETIHRRLEWELGKEGAYLDGIYVCPHHPDKGFAGERTELKIACDCRKPATGLFTQACIDLDVDVENSWMIGDQTRDIEMARRAGLRSILLRTGMAGRDFTFDAVPDFTADNIADAADLILREAALIS